MKRKSLPFKTRLLIYRLHNGRCNYCSTKTTLFRNQSRFTGCGTRPGAIDHIVPVKLGGTNNLKNLQLLCETCNSQKGAKPDFHNNIMRGAQ